MAMNIKDAETEQLIAQLAELTGETKTGAVRGAVRARIEQLRANNEVAQRKVRLRRLLEDEIWPLIPPDELGKPLSKEEQEDILGLGPDGV
jgi:antitoxin VapB